MSWSGKKVLVTGAGGFIGSHLVERLIAEGAHVRAMIRYTSRGDLSNLAYADPAAVRQAEVYRADLKDADAVREAVRGVDTVFHLGALIAIPYSYVNPRDVVDTNVMGTLNVLMAARAEGVRRIVHTSTSEVYGTARYVPIDEAHPLQGQSPYSASKIAADRIAESFHKSFGVPVTTLRPFNTFGPRQSARAIIPTIIVQALTRDEVKLGSLAPSRDFTYVDDTVAGFLRIAECDAAIGEEVNLGTGVAVTIGELVQRIFRIIGKSPKVVTEPQRMRPEKSEVMRLLSANKRAAEWMGWRPEVSLDEGLRATVGWVRANLASYRPDEYGV